MKPLSMDLTVFNKLDLPEPPVGVKFTFFRPEGMEQLGAGEKLSLCEIFKKAQATNSAFYFARDNNETCVGKILLGMEEMEPFAESGQIGVRLGVFQEARANQHLYQHIPKINKGIVNYVAFSPLNKLTYNPDVLVISANPTQAEIVMRAISYSTGELFRSTATPVMGCAWFLIYPYVTGKINFILPELVHGLKGRGLFAPDTLLISIPYQWIPTVAANLQEMEIHLPSHESKEAYYAEFAGILADLAEKSKNP